MLFNVTTNIYKKSTRTANVALELYMYTLRAYDLKLQIKS